LTPILCVDGEHSWTDGAGNGAPRTRKNKRLIFEKDILHRGGQTRLKFV